MNDWKIINCNISSKDGGPSFEQIKTMARELKINVKKKSKKQLCEELVKYSNTKNIRQKSSKKVNEKIDNKISIKNRLLFNNQLQSVFQKFEIKENKACISGGTKLLKKYVDVIKKLGSGTFGVVYYSCIKDTPKCFAIKEAAIKKNEIKTKKGYTWWEIHILQNLINPLVYNKICPNLPILTTILFCDQCVLEVGFPVEIVRSPCSLMITELADGTLADWFKKEKPLYEEQCNALFQIMAGTHAIQQHIQMTNNDIKAQNILYYKLKSKNGIWIYEIFGKKYFIKNLGYVFVLNDFGVASVYNSSYPYHESDIVDVGQRIIKNSPNSTNIMEWSDVKKSDFMEWSDVKNSDFMEWSDVKNSDFMEWSDEKKMFKKGTKMKLYDNPPFEFYNDTQDTIRTFSGGKRTVQPSNHTVLDIDYILKNKLKKYIGKLENSTSVGRRPMKTYFVLAGKFIEYFFKNEVDYTKKIPEVVIEKYRIS